MPVGNIQEYAADVKVAYIRAGWTGWTVAAGWLAFPFGLATLFHPEDALRLQDIIEGQTSPYGFTAQQLSAGFMETAFVLAALVLVQWWCTVLFYRRAKMSGAVVATPPLWPLAAIVPGVIGNLAWYYATGAFDFNGSIIGIAPTGLTIAAEMVCERLGLNFVLGPTAAAWNTHP
jgi:hypothetical protein